MNASQKLLCTGHYLTHPDDDCDAHHRSSQHADRRGLDLVGTAAEMPTAEVATILFSMSAGILDVCGLRLRAVAVCGRQLVWSLPIRPTDPAKRTSSALILL
jgi:hypothetical protein